MPQKAKDPPALHEQLVAFVSSLPLLSAIAYGCAYFRDSGERSITGVPSAFIEFTWTDAFTTFLGTAYIVLGTTVVMLFVAYAATQASVTRRRIITTIGALLFFAIAQRALVPGWTWNWRDPPVALLASTVFGWKVGPEAAPNRSFRAPVAAVLLLTVGTATFMMQSAYYTGKLSAERLAQYLVIPEQPPQVVLRMLQDRAVVAPLHRALGTYDDAFKLVDLKGVVIRYEQLGALRRSPMISACATERPIEAAATGPSSIADAHSEVATDSDDMSEEPTLCEAPRLESAPPP